MSEDQDDHRGRHDREHEERTEGGDPVCWLDRVCDECGAMREDIKAARCGTPFRDASADPDGTQQPPTG